jgi:hypothetical protein
MASLTVKDVQALDEVVSAQRYPSCQVSDVMAMLKSAHCASQNKHVCDGPLWECESCGLAYCCIEGSDGDNLCDACWATENEETR